MRLNCTPLNPKSAVSPAILAFPAMRECHGLRDAWSFHLRTDIRAVSASFRD